MAGERTGGQKKALADGPAADTLPLELVADQRNIQGIGQGLAAEAQLYCRSRSSVEVRSWPGQTWKSPSNWPRRFREDMISS